MPSLRAQARDFTRRLLARGVRDAKATSPVRTRRLQRSIRARRRGLRSWRIRANTNYARYVLRHRRNFVRVARRMSGSIRRQNFREDHRGRPRRVPARELVSAEYAESRRWGPAIDVKRRLRRKRRP